MDDSFKNFEYDKLDKNVQSFKLPTGTPDISLQHVW